MAFCCSFFKIFYSHYGSELCVWFSSNLGQDTCIKPSVGGVGREKPYMRTLTAHVCK